MGKNLTCFKCWQPTAILTYEENRVYKVACPCGCEYAFNHCSLADALAYHNKMLELYGQIDANNSLHSRLTEVEKERDTAVKSLNQKCIDERAAVKCICDIETYLELGSAKYIRRTIDAWRRTEARP